MGVITVRGTGWACVVGVTAAILLVSGCGETFYQGVCQDVRTHVRVADDVCNKDGSRSGWVYYFGGSPAPPVGGSTAGAPGSPGSSSFRNGGISPGGGTVSDDEGSSGSGEGSGSGSGSGSDEGGSGASGGGEGSSGGSSGSGGGGSGGGGE